jgi:hypothetical protein
VDRVNITKTYFMVPVQDMGRVEGGVRLISFIDSEGNSLTLRQQPSWGEASSPSSST